MSGSSRYLRACIDALQALSISQEDAIARSADVITNCIQAGGMVYSFGTGHSHELAEEIAYRAGGLVPVSPILEPSLTGHTEVSKSAVLEQLEGFAAAILDYYRVSRHDVLIIVSNSGRNAAPVETAIEAQRRGIPVIAVTSLAYSHQIPSRQASGKKLYEVADIVLDNGSPFGDAAIELEGLSQSVGPLSTVTGAALLHAVMVGVAERLIGKLTPVPVFRSGNLDDAAEDNDKLMNLYQGRVHIW